MKPHKVIERMSKRLVVGLSKFFLKIGRPDYKIPEADSIERILLVRPEKLGDLVVTLPIADALNKGIQQSTGCYAVCGDLLNTLLLFKTMGLQPLPILLKEKSEGFC